jgi:hypothetical protein
MNRLGFLPFPLFFFRGRSSFLTACALVVVRKIWTTKKEKKKEKKKKEKAKPRSRCRPLRMSYGEQNPAARNSMLFRHVDL